MATAAIVPETTAIPTGPASQRRRRPRNRNRGGGGGGDVESQNEPAPPSTRGGRSGGGRGNRAARGGGVSIAPEHTLPSSSTLQTTGGPDTNTNIPTPANTTAPSRRGGRARGGDNVGRGRGRGGDMSGGGRGRGGLPDQVRFNPRMAGGRQFGGQLTADGNDASTTSSTLAFDPSGLQADAPEFEPGKPLVNRKQQPRAPRQKRPQAPKSSAADIATRTHEDIDNGHYECAICTEEVRRSARVWSCRTCWTVFHLGCIKKWSTKEGSAAARQQVPDGEIPPPRQWRCPGCNLPKDVLPTSFACWCEKETDPKSTPGLPPFSCGQTCSRPRIVPKKCPHPCPSTCHAGPCPPCSQMGPTQFCFCGKRSNTRRCTDTNYENGWSCGNVCGEVMPCGEHTCDRPCHEGTCGACEVRVPARCHCGQISKDILCCDRGDAEEISQIHIAADGSAVVDRWVGLFKCPNTCGRQFDCGKHQCEKPCHTQTAQSPHCPRSPDVVSHCPCGKTPLVDISDSVRQTCEDNIPNCSKACAKTLDCGHKCRQLCHQGECLPCLQTTTISCRCGRTTSSTVCHQGTEERPQCMRVCRVSLNCGRHECGERCCSGERKASERQSSRRKARPLNSAPRQIDDGYEAEHICTRSCGRQLKCGNPNHRCQELCHKGPCGTCRDAIFEDISCNCGRTTLTAPLPCGTQPPPCRFQCNRPKDCGHPQVVHSCHQDEESCPKCPFLTTKPCLCSKNSLKNQPCWLNEVRCGEVCGRKLKCGAHHCQKQCHRPGDCDEPCRQACGKELSVCGHPCMAPCHSPIPCKADKPCGHKIFVTCECQRIKQEAKCNASKNGEGNLKKTLKCDEECARLERNRKLALALNVDAATHQNDHIPYSNETMNMYQENSTWAATQEKELRNFAANPEEKRLRFKPMPAHQRAFLHSIAEDFGIDSESMDPEPHRHIAIFKTPRFVMAPMKTLAECARIRQVQRLTSSSSSAAAPPTTARVKAHPLSGEPFNAFLITNARFALTIEEVTSVVKAALPKTNFPLQLEVDFLPSEEVVVRPPPMARANLSDRDVQAMLESIKPTLAQEMLSHKMGKLQLARLDASLNVLRKELDAGPGAGWSQVAAKGAATRKLEGRVPVGTKGGFAVLSLSSTRKKKKEKAMEVVDDWEAAEMMEEEKERVSDVHSGATSADEGPGPSEVSRPRSVLVEKDGEAQDVGSGEAAMAALASASSAIDRPDGGGDAEVVVSTTPSKGRWADMEDEEE
ncbi:hypothetical protein K504DRAFT_463948 [Pleomassaria siparia CBS 279.74]|uniref:R3H domain-containing protein n=1 Tax=Pleomassaria siparia CBS 279.74 TaxID=1314801 RepID=A0A6G1JRM8_9PLEO|nr:hypothetical protein K504DRAFT_463948 [Pleomassaria siparia CBS 279.74]